MRLSALAATCVAVSLLFAGAVGAAPNTEPVRLTGPVSHDNLAIYFVHGVSKSGPVPLTLAEAMAQRVVQVRETGNVNSLEIENLGDQDVFVQAGDPELGSPDLDGTAKRFVAVTAGDQVVPAGNRRFG